MNCCQERQIIYFDNQEKKRGWKVTRVNEIVKKNPNIYAINDLKNSNN
ncbi:MAG: hypothetical protein MRERC_11c038 [Mycoplasmataceae bacterium RC_NB112A]|nr:MAG: hypothetical protein MRERC_11c038 [Mycoplasmataceae bacterium RC_NB112A]